MKKIFKIISLLFIPLSLSAALISNKNSTPAPVEAASSGYRVRINFAVTDDADYWGEATFHLFVRSNHGFGEERLFHSSENFYESVSYAGANYTSSEINTGTAFPCYVRIHTGLGAFWQYHYGEADIKVYVNGINVAYQHISYGDWNYTNNDNYVTIDQSKYPYPDAKKIKVDYSENVDPDEESTQKVKISAVDQYGVNWTAPASSPISLINESYPDSDTAQRLDGSGFLWKLNSSLTSNHYSTYNFKIPTASIIYPIVEKKFTVQFAFPLHINIMVNNKLARRISGYEGDVITLPQDLETPVGYYIANYKKTGMGTLEQDKTNKTIFKFTFISGDTTLTATLKPIQYKVRFDSNGEAVTGIMLDKTVNYDAKNAYLPINRFVREGYTFLGWNTKKDGSGTSFNNQARITNLTSTKDEIVVLYAQWESNNPSVTASLFTDGSFGLILGGVLAVGAIVTIVIFMINKSKKRKA